ncbi:MAG: hypothetical protein JW797_19430 [Bradymonadales bacterium]|nr:hypothetical protein [Bradymonadales bacterium]
MTVKRVEAPEEFDAELDELEKKIERLRILYEQYFLGIEKLPPYSLQQEVVRIFHQFSTYHIRKTNHKFRYQALTQRFNVHRAYWQRTVRAIEEGTYQRHRWRVERRELARTGELIDNEELSKRKILAELKGDEAVEERRRRMLQAANEELVALGSNGALPQPALLRGIERRLRRRKKRLRALEGISGVPLDELRRRAEEARSEQETSGQPSLPGGDVGADPSATPVEPAAGPAFGPVLPAAGGPARPGLLEFPKLRVALGGQGDPGPRIPVLGRQAVRPPVAPTSHGVDRTLAEAGISKERAQQIYDQFLAARQKSGQSVEHMTFDRLAESMARQVVKARQTLGVEQVDFNVVSKEDKIFLKPVPK